MLRASATTPSGGGGTICLLVVATQRQRRKRATMMNNNEMSYGTGEVLWCFPEHVTTTTNLPHEGSDVSSRGFPSESACPPPGGGETPEKIGDELQVRPR